MKKKQPSSPLENNIYKIISDRNITQAELGRKIGVKRSYINRIINRKITPTVPLALRIAKALGSTVEEVFYEA
jgi:putative transcriptional regulator